MKPIKTSPLIAIGLIGFLLCLTGAASPYLIGKSCTIFTAVEDDLVLFGNSEDQHNPDPVLGIFPLSPAGYGSVHFGVKYADGRINFEGAVNDQGLAWDVNSTPKFKLNDDPGKPYFLGSQNYLTTITKGAATVEEAIQMAEQYDFGKSLAGQYHIADATGDAVVISAGPNGELAFTRKPPGDGYHLSTNFNLAQPERGPVDFRWETAGTMLDALDQGKTLTPAYAGKILKAVHLETLTSYTLYSNVLDLKNKKIYLNYMAKFDETAEIDMDEEFARGKRVVEMRDFFSPATAAAGDAAYQRFANRFFAAKAAVITIGTLLLLGSSFLLIRTAVRRRRQKSYLKMQEMLDV